MPFSDVGVVLVVYGCTVTTRLGLDDDANVGNEMGTDLLSLRLRYKGNDERHNE
jgi:hypothetical protein